MYYFKVQQVEREIREWLVEHKIAHKWYIGAFAVPDQNIAMRIKLIFGPHMQEVDENGDLLP